MATRHLSKMPRRLLTGWVRERYTIMSESETDKAISAWFKSIAPNLGPMGSAARHVYLTVQQQARMVELLTQAAKKHRGAVLYLHGGGSVSGDVVAVNAGMVEMFQADDMITVDGRSFQGQAHEHHIPVSSIAGISLLST